jgi:Domain of unknown function (DUF4395)
MRKSFQFGEDVPGYDIRVLNEREIRAAAGLLFVATFTSFLLIMTTNNFTPVKYVLTIFLVDFILRVFVSPRYAPTLILGRLIVRNQTPEYVGARQKRFAWTIGLILSAVMFVFMVVVNAYSPITGITCLVCLLFTFFESAFGICLACKFYSAVFRKKAQYCPGEVCDIRSRQPIQKTSRAQLLVAVSVAVLLTFFGIRFGGYFSRQPYDLFGINTTAKTK